MHWIEEDDAPVIATEDVTNLIRPFNEKELLKIVQNAAQRHPDVLEEIRQVANLKDRADGKKVLVEGFSSETTLNNGKSGLSHFGQMEESTMMVQKTTGKSPGGNLLPSPTHGSLHIEIDQHTDGLALNQQVNRRPAGPGRMDPTTPRQGYEKGRGEESQHQPQPHSAAIRTPGENRFPRSQLERHWSVVPSEILQPSRILPGVPFPSLVANEELVNPKARAKARAKALRQYRVLRLRQSRARAERRKSQLHNVVHLNLRVIRRGFGGPDGEKEKEEAAAKTDGRPRDVDRKSSEDNHNFMSNTLDLGAQPMTDSSQQLQDGASSSQGVPTLPSVNEGLGELSEDWINDLVTDSP